MATIAYVDHSYHKKTGSNLFLVELLRKYGHDVHIFWDEAWHGGNEITFESVLDYDVIIMFQSCCISNETYYRLRHDNVITIPMLDQFAIFMGGKYNCNSYWERFQGSKALCFSNAIFSITSAFGLRSMRARYYPQVEKSTIYNGLHGFFWLRREEQINWDIVRKLIGTTEFESFHLHITPDPQTPQPSIPSKKEMRALNLSITHWFDDKKQFDDILRSANVFFAPRLEEGIGQSFLEAMARGQCVVACDNSTMNEYIINGLNGILYDPNSPKPIDFSTFELLGKNARRTVAVGHSQWQNEEAKILDFILTPSSQLYKGYYHHPALSMQHLKCRTKIEHTNDWVHKYILRWKIIRRTRWLWGPLWYRYKRLQKMFVHKQND